MKTCILIQKLKSVIVETLRSGISSLYWWESVSFFQQKSHDEDISKTGGVSATPPSPRTPTTPSGSMPTIFSDSSSVSGSVFAHVELPSKNAVLIVSWLNMMLSNKVCQRVTQTWVFTCVMWDLFSQNER